MARIKTAFVSAFDIAASIFKLLTNAVIDAGGTEEQVRLLETDTELRRQVGQLIASWDKPVVNGMEEQLQWWIAFWATFGFIIDPSEVVVPAVPSGFGPVRLVVIPKGLTIQKAWDIAKSLFPCYSYIGGNLDEAIPTNDRIADKTYVVAFRDVQEADEQFRNLSANDLKARGHKGITALETIVDEIGYFKRTGQHRDINNVTLCAGSRDSGGSVPGSYWYGGKFRLRWDYPDNADDDLRSRQAVS